MRLTAIGLAILFTVLLGPSAGNAAATSKSAEAGKAAAGDPVVGAAIFEEECAECHTTTARNKKKGPALRGIVGRKAGSVPGFADYSEQMKNSKLIWTAPELDKYLAGPKHASPIANKKYKRLAEAKARADLIEFLASKK